MTEPISQQLQLRRSVIDSQDESLTITVTSPVQHWWIYGEDHTIAITGYWKIQHYQDLEYLQSVESDQAGKRENLQASRLTTSATFSLTY